LKGVIYIGIRRFETTGLVTEGILV